MSVHRAPSVPDRAGCPSEDLIVAHLAGTLEPEARDELRVHLDTCHPCRSALLHARRAIKQEVAATTPGHSIEAVPASLPGEIVANRYKLLRVIGHGGMGTVYEAADLSLHRLVAIKVLRVGAASESDRGEPLQRLIREARAMAMLSHKNVVTVYDVGPHGDQVFVAMEFIAGVTLRTWLAREPRSLPEILRVLHDAGTGLAAAHAARLVHRDFKPDNVLVSSDGTARVTDFGLARRAELDTTTRIPAFDLLSQPLLPIDDAAGITRSGAILGTPAYMAPEQAQADPCDARADQFSFCVTAWEALFGARPYPGSTWSEIYSNALAGAIKLPADVRQVPRAIQKVLRRGMAGDPRARFPSMEPILEALATTIRDLRRASKVRRNLVMAGLTIGVIGLAVGTYQLVGTSRGIPSASVAAPIAPAAPAPPITEAASAATTPVLAATAPEVAPTGAPPPTTEQVNSGSATEDGEPTPSVAVATTKAPARSRGKKRRKVRVAIDSSTETPPATTEAAAPESKPVDPRLTELASSRASLKKQAQARGLLTQDLPATVTDALDQLDAALAAQDVARADQALARARAGIASVAIDQAFVDNKLQRINRRLQRLPPGREEDFKLLLREVLNLCNASDYLAANKKLNQIAAQLIGD